MKYIFMLLIIMSSNKIIAQQFVFDLMEKTELQQIKFSQAESIAKHYFDSVGTDRPTGYKHFQRWMYEKRFHQDENGYLINPDAEWQIWKNTTPNNFGIIQNGRTEAITWNELGPWGWTYSSSWNPGTGRLTDIAIDPSDTTIIYVTSPGGGIWKSTNSGNSWFPLQDFNSTWMNMYAVTIDPNNTNIVYAGNASGNVMKSINAGNSWSTLSIGSSGAVRKILIHPTNSNVIFVCSSSGIHRSIDGGLTWILVHNTQKEDIEFKTDDVNIMIATGNSSIIRSIDNGVNWTTLGVAEGITNTGRSLVGVTPANPNYMYIIQANGSEFGRMYKSVDGGLSFSTTVVGSASTSTNYFGYSPLGTDVGGQGSYDMALTVSPFNANEVYLAGVIVWKSINGGTSFVAQTEWDYPNGTGYNHADVHGLRWVNNTLYSNSDGGIFKSIDKADNWTNISTGLGIRQFYRIACSPTDANVITGGAQDNGSVTRKSAGNWVDWLGADGMEGLISPTNINNLWGTSQNGNIYRSINGGNSYSNLFKPSNGNWVTPLAIHPTNQNTLYGGWTGFYKSVNAGVNWTLLSGSTILGTLDNIAIAPSDTNYIYASRGTFLYTSIDAGVTWTSTVLVNSITDICVHRTIPNKIYVTCNSSSNQILVSTDAGANFTSISTGLPSVAARTVVVENNAVQGLYVGMNTGVYYKNDTMANWLNYTGNLPTVAVNELEIQYTVSKLRVATYGRGIWDTPLFGVAVLPIKLLSFTASQKNNGVQLNWNVTGEKALTKYELQRSNNGIQFNTIKTINAHNQSPAAYDYFDNELPQNIVYYRIKEITDNVSTYSNIISIKSINKFNNIQIQSNPIVDGMLNFGFTNSTGILFDIQILSIDGKLMMVHKSTNAFTKMDISKLPNGIYQLIIIQGKDKLVERFVKGN
jgi:hypothetical protein